MLEQTIDNPELCESEIEIDALLESGAITEIMQDVLREIFLAEEEQQ